MKPYEYQLEGVSKTRAFLQKQHGSILADEPGLGKTVQATELVNQEGCEHILIVCPASLKLNWRDELYTWLKDRSYSINVLRGTSAVPATPPGLKWIDIVNYELLNSLDFSNCVYDLIIYDEAHLMKNPEAIRTGAGANIVAKNRLLMTGTPIMNRPKEIWQLMLLCGLCTPEEFHQFGLKYCNAREVEEFRRHGPKVVRKKVWNYDGHSNLDELNYWLYEKCMVRRRKADVLTELPAKTRRIVTLENRGHSDYRAVVDLKALRSRFNNLHTYSNPARGTAQYEQDVARLQDDIKLALEEVSRVRHETALAKVPQVIEYLEGALNESEKIVVAAYHRDVIEELSQWAWDSHHQPVSLIGGMSEDSKHASVQAFQHTPSCRLFFGQIQAAGVGLTLTASSRIVFAELDWSPAIVSQYEDRCHRIGQKDNVLIEHLVLENSIDARMAKVLVAKQKILDSTLDSTGGVEIDWFQQLT